MKTNLNTMFALNTHATKLQPTVIANELAFIQGELKKIYEYQVERFKYNNLPQGITKYRLEKKLLQYGLVLVQPTIIDYNVFNISVKKWNMYDEPVEVIIQEPKSSLNGKVVKLNGKNGVIFRNNDTYSNNFNEIYRLVADLEKTLFQIEKNLTASAPKGIVNLKNYEIVGTNETDTRITEKLEEIFTGEKTFYTLTSKPSENQDLENENEEEIFTKIELTDRTTNLIIQFKFFKEQLKEMVGIELNADNPKKERAITGELEHNQSIPNAMFQHAYNVRTECIDKLNTMFNLDMSLEVQGSERVDVDDTKGVEDE